MELKELREEWISMRREFEDRWTANRDEYIGALDKLARLQNVYARWSVPANLTDGRVQEKLDDVAAVDFQALRDGVPDLKNIADPIEAFDVEEAWWNCRETASVRPPKGYGRDYRDQP